MSRSRTWAIARIPWPVVTIDFEASSLAKDSYPIEVGVARWERADRPIGTWSTLIRPPEDWRTRTWSDQSQQIHGIRREDLDSGMDPVDIVPILDRLVGRQAFCDGGQHDLRWLAGLEDAAGRETSFILRDWDAVGGALHASQWKRMTRWHDRRPARHRAGDDAERLLKSLAAGLALTYGQTRRLE